MRLGISGIIDFKSATICAAADTTLPADPGIFRPVVEDPVVIRLLVIGAKPDPDRSPVPFLQHPVAIVYVVIADARMFSVAFDAGHAIVDFIVPYNAVFRTPGDMDGPHFPNRPSVRLVGAGYIRCSSVAVKILNANITSRYSDRISEIIPFEYRIGECRRRIRSISIIGKHDQVIGSSGR